MIAYKATYNYKCLKQTYKVGKTYTSDKFKICHHGMHYCNKMEDTLNYYLPTKDFILLEVEILGDVETEEDKSVTNKLKVLRIVSPDEYSNSMKSRFPVLEYDDHINLFSETSPSGRKYTYKYDDRGNMISETDSDGRKYAYEYDSSGNKISETYPSGYKITYEYDDRGNMISATYLSGNKYTYEYDDRGNRISATDSDGDKYAYEYDDRGNRISATDSDGRKYTFDVAIITEED
jgi:YD repeat-containing protein